MQKDRSEVPQPRSRMKQLPVFWPNQALWHKCNIQRIGQGRPRYYLLRGTLLRLMAYVASTREAGHAALPR